jgi:hypothetical protein
LLVGGGGGGVAGCFKFKKKSATSKWPNYANLNFKRPLKPILAKVWQNSATKSSGQLYFSPAPFELFGRSFGHLATLPKIVFLETVHGCETGFYSADLF